MEKLYALKEFSVWQLAGGAIIVYLFVRGILGPSKKKEGGKGISGLKDKFHKDDNNSNTQA